MKTYKWYHKLFGLPFEDEENLKFKRKRIEVYELFKKNKFKEGHNENQSKT